MNKNSSGKMKEKSSSSSDKVMDGSDITQLVENEKVFSNFVDHKFQELDTDCDGKLSVKELQPAVADIGAALGLPAQGTNPESDYIYTEVSCCPFSSFFCFSGSTNNFVYVHIAYGWYPKIQVSEVYLFLYMCLGLLRGTYGMGTPMLCSPQWSILGGIAFELIFRHTMTLGMQNPTENSAVLNEFTHGKLQKISKPEFKEVLSDFLLGMAAGLKRDPVVILRIDGEDLHEFVKSLTFEPEMLSIFSEIGLPGGSLKDYIIKAFEKLTVDHGMPPATDPWVMSNVVEPALECLGDALQLPISQDTFLAAFKRAAESIVQLLKEQPAIVAHSQNTFDGSGIKKLLSNKFELDKAMDSALRGLPRERHGTISKEYLGVALDSLAASADLPPLGAIDQMDDIMNEALKMVGVESGEGRRVQEVVSRSSREHHAAVGRQLGFCVHKFDRARASRLILHTPAAIITLARIAENNGNTTRITAACMYMKQMVANLSNYKNASFLQLCREVYARK
ncbi:UNVERIFIED_CONTAM: hypothetical protein Sradi_2572100 [Sesamum radiatum]|uniref:EF-hand domain-containing protein n=1 Tax=Sesamum radiatum TaxID=300843 RepID=A0AAW2S3F8_SESRA